MASLCTYCSWDALPSDLCMALSLTSFRSLNDIWTMTFNKLSLPRSGSTGHPFKIDQWNFWRKTNMAELYLPDFVLFLVLLLYQLWENLGNQSSKDPPPKATPPPTIYPLTASFLLIALIIPEITEYIYLFTGWLSTSPARIYSLWGQGRQSWPPPSAWSIAWQIVQCFTHMFLKEWTNV